MSRLLNNLNIDMRNTLRSFVAVLGTGGIFFGCAAEFHEVLFKTTPDPALKFLWFLIGCMIGISIDPNIKTDSPTLRWLFDFASFIPRNIWLWVFGNIEEHRTLKDIHNATLALEQSLLFGRLADLRTSKTEYYHIVYTHKGNNHDLGDLENYKIPGFPYDEAEIIMLLWYFVASNLNLGWDHIRTVCACSHNTDKIRTEIERSSFSLVGSPKGNVFSGQLMKQIEDLERRDLIRRQHLFTMKIDNECYLHDARGSDLRPDPTDPYHPDEKKTMKDYAMMMKLPNILSDRRTDAKQIIFLFAGCKVAGQVALTRWIANPENLAKLTNDYSSKFFQVILGVDYKFVQKGLPDILKVEPIISEQIDVDMHKVFMARRREG